VTGNEEVLLSNFNRTPTISVNDLLA
jgi:hypothetical protein